MFAANLALIASKSPFATSSLILTLKDPSHPAFALSFLLIKIAAIQHIFSSPPVVLTVMLKRFFPDLLVTSNGDNQIWLVK